ncbi:MAG: hypothetical protein ACUVQ0_06495 [Thermoproteota archaeon]
MANSLIKEAPSEEKAFLFRSALATAKRLVDSKLDGSRLNRISSIIRVLRTTHGGRMLYSS